PILSAAHWSRSWKGGVRWASHSRVPPHPSRPPRHKRLKRRARRSSSNWAKPRSRGTGRGRGRCRGRGRGGGGRRKLIGFTVDEVIDMLTTGGETTLEDRQGLPGVDPTLVRAVGR